MNLQEYAATVTARMADQEKIRLRHISLLQGPNGLALTMLENGVRGLADEIGELNNILKKHIEYGQGLDLLNLIEELGDCYWRLEQCCQAERLSVADIMAANDAKLEKRYPLKKYSDERAVEANRDRIAEREAVQTQTPPTLPEENNRLLEQIRAATKGQPELVTLKEAELGERFMAVKVEEHPWFPAVERGKPSNPGGIPHSPQERVAEQGVHPDLRHRFVSSGGYDYCTVCGALMSQVQYDSRCPKKG